MSLHWRLLQDTDPDIAKAIRDELHRQSSGLELIASENFVSRAILEAAGSVFTNKYAEGYPGRRYYGGCEYVDVVETLAIDRAKQLFGANFANVQANSGSQMNQAAFLALLQPGDTFMGLDLAAGGHLTHGSPVNMSGKWFKPVAYGVRRDDQLIDMDEVAAIAREHQPKLIIAGATAYSRHWDFARFREIADEVGALFMVDMAHFAGLVAADLHPSPIPHADVVTTTIHKTIGGGRGGMILCREEHAQALDRAVFPGMQGGPMEHVIAAKATCFRIAGTPAFREYQTQVRANADALADELQTGGLDVLTGGTDTHLLQVDLRASEWTGKDAEERLAEVNITANRNTVPFDERPPRVASGVRMGTPACTMRGFGEEDFREVARIAVASLQDDADVDVLAERSVALCERHPLYPGFRGWTTYEA